MLYSVVPVSAIQPRESVITIHTSSLTEPPFFPPQPQPSVLTEHEAELPVSYSDSLLAVCFTHGGVYVSVPLSQFFPPFPSPNFAHYSILYVCVSASALQIDSLVPFFLDSMYMP